MLLLVSDILRKYTVGLSIYHLTNLLILLNLNQYIRDLQGMYTYEKCTLSSKMVKRVGPLLS